MRKGMNPDWGRGGGEEGIASSEVMHNSHKPTSGPVLAHLTPSPTTPSSPACSPAALQPGLGMGRLPPRVSISLHARCREAVWFQVPGWRDKGLCLCLFPLLRESGEGLLPLPVFPQGE